jgi:hypothetical protein
MSHTNPQASAKFYKSTIFIKQEGKPLKRHRAGVWTRNGLINLIAQTGIHITTESLHTVNQGAPIGILIVQLVVMLEKAPSLL